MSSRVLAAATVGVGLLLAFGAAAQEPPPPPPPADAEVDMEGGEPHPRAPDWRAGHILLAGKASLVGPTGTLATLGEATYGTSPPPLGTSERAGGGFGFGGTLGVGISRHVFLQGSGEYLMFTAPVGCTTCSGTGYDFGFGLGYHLAQGIAVDPWMSYEVGYRSLTFETASILTGQLSKQAYTAVDFMRVALGADFYPLPFLGIGPFFESDVGVTISQPSLAVAQPPGLAQGSGVYAFFQLGVRVVLDPLRTPGSVAPARTTGAASAPATLP